MFYSFIRYRIFITRHKLVTSFVYQRYCGVGCVFRNNSEDNCNGVLLRLTSSGNKKHPINQSQKRLRKSLLSKDLRKKKLEALVNLLVQKEVQSKLSDILILSCLFQRELEVASLSVFQPIHFANALFLWGKMTVYTIT